MGAQHATAASERSSPIRELSHSNGPGSPPSSRNAWYTGRSPVIPG